MLDDWFTMKSYGTKRKFYKPVFDSNKKPFLQIEKGGLYKHNNNR